MANITAASVTASAPTDTVAPQPAVPKMSFASVAARAATPKLNKPASTMPLAENRPPPDHVEAAGNNSRLAGGDTINGIQQSVAKLHVSGGPGPVIASADTDAEQPEPLIMALQNDDDKTHLSFVSNPTVSTDVRSVASGTAFNLDEKESIRPDDSASVKAADESDSMSGQGSGGLQSQVASEAGKDGFRDQFQEVSSAKKALPLTTTLVGRVPDDAGRTVIPAAIDFQPERPDPKLTDALENPKDRIFLLQLEQQVIAFVADPKQEALALPPQNSFCRLLAHRLGDYYMLSHTADTSMGNVTLRKTETTRLPPSLKELSSPTTPDSAAPQHQPALKIMRRKTGTYGKDNGDDAAASSGIQSQSGSDTGASGIDLQRSPSKGAKANMTREEREAHYQATRDRIFGDMEEAKPSTETSTAASRASSTTGGKPKKQKNRPKNDDFEPRSMFMNMGYQQQQQQAGYGYPDRSQQAMYNFPPVAPNMPPQNMTLGYGDGSLMHNSQFPPPQQGHQIMPQTMSMGGGMQAYGQPNIPQQPVYTGSYGYAPQAQNMAPMPMQQQQQQQQQYYSGSDQGSPYSNNMMGAPMMINPSQQGYAPGYQGWNQGMPMQYPPQDQSGYFPQHAPNGYPGGVVYQGASKPTDGTTPPGARFGSAEYGMPSPVVQQQQQQQQQGQWNQWQGPTQYSQYPNNQMSWQSSQSSIQGPLMHPNAAMKPQKINAYQNQNPNTGKAGKKGGKGKGAASELGKYDTSSLPPKPPAPMQTDQGV